MALFQRGAGDIEHALANGEKALMSLREMLYETHPWVLAAAINHASTLAVSDEIFTALELLERAHTDCHEYLGDDHPFTKIACSNLEHTRRLVAGSVQPTERWRDVDIDLN
jgi:hypothetical protein